MTHIFSIELWAPGDPGGSWDPTPRIRQYSFLFTEMYQANSIYSAEEFALGGYKLPGGVESGCEL